jgi:hypothetical protein
MMEEELKVAAVKEAEEAEEEAGDKEDREMFEQRCVFACCVSEYGEV